MTPGLPSWFGFLRAAPLVLLVLLAGATVFDAAREPSAWQWDLRVYRAAAQAHQRGADPYRLPDEPPADLEEDHRREFGVPLGLRYVYPPAALVPFRALAALDFVTAAHVFLALKVLAGVLLVVLWRRRFVPAPLAPAFYLFVAVGFRGALLLDVKAGNVTVFEQLLLWSAFALLLSGRAVAGAVLIPIAAFFKVTPLVFLAALPFLPVRRRGLALLAAAAVTVLLAGASWAVSPELSRRFAFAAGALDERGVINPAVLALVRDVADRLTARTGLGGEGLPWLLYGAVALAVFACTWRALLRLRVAAAPDRDALVLYLLCAASVLVLPRFKDYSYVLLIVPALATAARAGLILPFVALFALAALPLPPFPGHLLWQYLPLVTAFLTWWLLLRATVPRPAVPAAPAGTADAIAAGRR